MIAGGGILADPLHIGWKNNIEEGDRALPGPMQSLIRFTEDTIVLHGSGNEPLLLKQENIENTDVFCALTDNDESNIMMSLLAKKLGAKKVITLITNAVYADLIGDEIDTYFATTGNYQQSLMHVRQGDISAVHSLRRGAAVVDRAYCSRRCRFFRGWAEIGRTQPPFQRHGWCNFKRTRF